MSEQLKTHVAGALRVLAEDRGATLSAVASQPALMTLECVVADASDSGRSANLEMVAGAAVLLIEEAADSLEPEPRSSSLPNRTVAAKVALGIASGTQGRPLRGRRGTSGRVPRLAESLACEPGTLFKARQDGRSPFDELLDDLAEAVVRREVSFLVAQRRAQQRARRPPLESAMRVDWLQRFERYYEMWTEVSATRYDLELAITHNRKGNTEDCDHFARKSLWYYANFDRGLADFVRDYGGLWIMPDPNAEQLISDAVWLLSKPMPLNEVERSRLRIALLDHNELATFFDAAHSDPAVQPLAAAWLGWIVSCECASHKRPRKSCKPHQTIGWLVAFMDALDEQWDMLADWYQVLRPETLVTPRVLASDHVPAPSTQTNLDNRGV